MSQVPESRPCARNFVPPPFTTADVLSVVMRPVDTRGLIPRNGSAVMDDASKARLGFSRVMFVPDADFTTPISHPFELKMKWPGQKSVLVAARVIVVSPRLTVPEMDVEPTLSLLAPRQSASAWLAGLS